MVLLNTTYFKAALRPLIAEWILVYLRSKKIAGIEDKDVIEYLMRTKGTVAIEQRVQKSLPGEFVQLLNLSHDWLQSYLPHVLGKINRVNFGLLTAADYARAIALDPQMPKSRKLLAVPFVGKDVPSRSSEFAHPDVVIGLSIAAYRYEGLRLMDFMTVSAASFFLIFLNFVGTHHFTFNNGARTWPLQEATCMFAMAGLDQAYRWEKDNVLCSSGYL